MLLLTLLAIAPVGAQEGSIAYGAAIFGSTNAQTPIVIHTFAGSADDVIHVGVTGLTPGFSPLLTLLSPTQQQLALEGADDVDPSRAAVSRRLTESGLHSLLISSASGTLGDFVLQLSARPTLPSTPLAPGSTTLADFPAGAAAQLYSFFADPNGPTQLTISAQPETFPFVGEIYNEQGEVIGQVGGGIHSAALTFEAGDGFYEVLITPSDPAAAGGVLLVLGAGSAPAVPAAPATSVPAAPVSTQEVTSGGGACAIFAGGRVNVRGGPGTNYSVIGQINAGTTLAVTGVNPVGDWYQVDYNGQVGWVSLTVVQVSGACSGLPVVQNGQAPGLTATTTTTTTVTVTATGTQYTATPSATYTATQPGAPTATYTSTQPGAPTATYTYTPTYTVTAQADLVPNFTDTPTLTPTVTYTPSYTPTTPPPPPTAPPDANYAITVPLDSTGSSTDFVSYPGGDTEDRLGWNVSGMNQNSALSGGRARLVIVASCFGTGTQNVQFFTGGQAYSCGQTIVDREITYEQRTGSAQITAFAGSNTYVQWVLTISVTRIN
jgi:uncharacterized protein YgiM (DUF1202 family)